MRSFWYPTWLAQPAALVPGSRLVDAPPAGLTVDDVVALAPDYELAVLHTSTPSFAGDLRVAEAMRAANPRLRIGLVGAHVAVQREAALAASPAIEFVTGAEFDFTIKEVAEGRPLGTVCGLSYRDGDRLRRTPERPPLEDMDALPFVVDVYHRDLVVEQYFIGYLLHPYVSLYTGRGCRSQVHLLSLAPDGGGAALSDAQRGPRGGGDRARGPATSRRSASTSSTTTPSRMTCRAPRPSRAGSAGWA